MVRKYQAVIGAFIDSETIELFEIRSGHQNEADEIFGSLYRDSFFCTRYILCEEKNSDVVGVIKVKNGSYWAELYGKYDYERGGKDIIEGGIRAKMGFPDSYSDTTFIDDKDYFNTFKMLLDIDIDVGKATLHPIPGQNLEVSGVINQKKRLFLSKGKYEI